MPEVHTMGMVADPVRDEPSDRESTRDLGARGEEAAARNLASRGWEILARNWTCELGEVDIIARDTSAPVPTLVLVEVKTRRAPSGEEVVPEVAVDEEKQRRYARLARRLLQTNPNIESVRFDVVAIADKGDGFAHLHHVFNAFQADN